MYLVTDKPQLSDTYLEHFGVKGMRWGSRKDGKPGSKRRRALKIGAAALVAGGAAVAVTVLVRNGRLPFSTSSASKAESGRRAAARVADQAAWKKNVASLRSDIRKGHEDQDRWMRSLGLGAAVNNRKTTDVNMGDLADVRRAMDDPNHVWKL